jgi:diketogulonate reductase-like aldo/keto reductase
MSGMTPFNARRKALQLVAGAAIAAGTQRASAAPSATADLPGAGTLIRRKIPASGELMPVIGLGTYLSFDVGSTDAERAPLREVLQNFQAAGGRLVDSSPMYGRSETVVGDLASGLVPAHPLFVATKVWTSGRAAGAQQMEESFKRLRVSTIDLMQVHNLLDLATHLPTLQAFRREGRLRYLGITHYQAGAYAELAQLLRRGGFDFVQFNYSIAEREAEQMLLELALDTGTAVIINRPFAQANLFQRVRGRTLPAWCSEFGCSSWAQFFLKYIIAHKAVTCVIPATGKPAHVLDNMGAGHGLLPDAANRRRMVALVDNL